MYKHLEFSASDSSALFGSTNICPVQNNPMWISGKSRVLCFVWSASHWERIIANRHIVVTTGQDEILGDTSIDTAGLQTATVDVNHIHKARYSVQLSVLSIYTCLKEAHKQVILHCFYFRGRKNVLHLVLCLCIGCRSWNSKSTT